MITKIICSHVSYNKTIGLPPNVNVKTAVYNMTHLLSIKRMQEGVRAKALPDICLPMKHGMGGHLPPKGIAGVDICPSLLLPKFPLKAFNLAKVVFIKHFCFSHGSWPAAIGLIIYWET